MFSKIRVLILPLILSAASCGTSNGTLNGSVQQALKQSSSTQSSARMQNFQVLLTHLSKSQNVESAIQAQLPSGSKVYSTGTTSFKDGNTVAAFVDGSTITKSSQGYTVQDIVTGETFNFSASAVLMHSDSSSFVNQKPGEPLPLWAAKSKLSLVKVIP